MTGRIHAMMMGLRPGPGTDRVLRQLDNMYVESTTGSIPVSIGGMDRWQEGNNAGHLAEDLRVQEEEGQRQREQEEQKRESPEGYWTMWAREAKSRWDAWEKKRRPGKTNAEKQKEYQDEQFQRYRIRRELARQEWLQKNASQDR